MPEKARAEIECEERELAGCTGIFGIGRIVLRERVAENKTITGEKLQLWFFECLLQKG
jgi:hypothetical protein